MSKRRGDGYYDAERDLWIGVVDFGRDEFGKRDRRKVSARTKTEMLRRRRELVAARDAGIVPVSRVLTTRAWLEEWIADIAPLTAQPQSVKTYREALESWVYPHIGNTPLLKFGPSEYRKLMKAVREQGLSAGSQQKVRAIMHRAFRCAVQDRKLTYNVIGEMDGVKSEHKVSDAMTEDEVKLVLAAVKGDRYEALAVLVLLCGLRQAEALDMRWDDLDLDAGVLEIPKSKTKAGERKIPLPKKVVTALKAHQEVQMLERQWADVWGDHTLVFTTSIGTRIHRRNILRWWHGVTERAGVGRRRFHAARHTTATVMKARGVDMGIVSKTLGHSRQQITNDLYVKADVEMLRLGSDVIDGVYGDE